MDKVEDERTRWEDEVETREDLVEVQEDEREGWIRWSTRGRGGRTGWKHKRKWWKYERREGRIR
jgi:hypothetical protein